MTSSTGAEQHPEVVEISALTDGLLPHARDVELRRHLAACATCQDVRLSLEEIRSLLGRLPGPVRTPVDVEERIDAALAAEALLESTRSQQASPSVSRETTARPHERPRVPGAPRATKSSECSGRVSRETHSSGQGELKARARWGRGIAGRTTAPRRESTGLGQEAGGPRQHRHWARRSLAAAAAVAVLGTGIAVVRASLETRPQEPTTAAASPHVTPDRNGLSEADIDSRVHALLHTTKASGTGAGETEGNGSSIAPLRGTILNVPPCVAAGTRRDEAPLAASRETYQGQAAYLLVLPHSSDPRQVTAYLVASSCTRTSSTHPGEVLLSRSYPRR